MGKDKDKENRKKRRMKEEEKRMEELKRDLEEFGDGGALGGIDDEDLREEVPTLLRRT